MAAGDPRDPVVGARPARRAAAPAPRRRSAYGPGGLAIVPAVEAALRDAARRLTEAGWRSGRSPTRRRSARRRSSRSGSGSGDGFAALAAAAEREGDPGALALMDRLPRRARRPWRRTRSPRRSPAARRWCATGSCSSTDTPVLLVPVSGELPFPDGQDLGGAAAIAAVWEAQLLQCGLPLIGVPALTVTTGPRRHARPSASSWWPPASARTCAWPPARRSRPAACRRCRSIRRRAALSVGA